MSSSEPMGSAVPFYQNVQGHLHFDPQNGQSFAGQFISAESCSLFTPQQIQQLNSQITAYNQSILNLQETMIVNGAWPFDFNPVPPGSQPSYTPITPGFELPIIETSSDKNSPSEIFEDVYLGTNEDATNVEELKKMGIRHVLGVDRDVKMDLFKHWDDVFEYISKAKKENSKVLIHGETGTSCSAAVVIAYAMKAYVWGFSHALNHVKTRRSCIEPNRSLLLQLLNYEGKLEVERRENNKLEIFDRSGSDTDKIVKRSGASDELNKNVEAPMRFDTIIIDDDSDDSIIDLPLSRIPSSMPEPNQQSSKTTNQKRAEFCRHFEELSPPKKSIPRSIPRSIRQKKYICPFKGCDRVYNHRSSYYSHRKTHDLAELISYEYLQQNGRRNASCNSVERFQCDHCRRIFFYRSSIAAHLKQCERGCESGNQKKYVCPYIGCDRVYNIYSSFRYHKKTHLRITCQYCQQNFVLPSRLKNHLDRCNGGKKFECDYCQRMFVNRPAIICHFNGCKQKKVNDQKNVDKEVSTTLSEKNKVDQM